MHLFPDMIELAQAIAENLNKKSVNQSQLIGEAEEILKAIQERDFYPTNVSLSDEQQLVMLALNQAKSLLNETLGLWNEVRKANRTLRELEGRFVQTLEKSLKVMENAREALVINSVSKGYDSEVTCVLLTSAVFM